MDVEVPFSTHVLMLGTLPQFIQHALCRDYPTFMFSKHGLDLVLILSNLRLDSLDGKE